MIHVLVSSLLSILALGLKGKSYSTVDSFFAMLSFLFMVRILQFMVFLTVYRNIDFYLVRYSAFSFLNRQFFKLVCVQLEYIFKTIMDIFKRPLLNTASLKAVFIGKNTKQEVTNSLYISLLFECYESCYVIETRTLAETGIKTFLDISST